MKNLMFNIVLSGSLIISSTGCSTRVLSNSSNTGSNITPIPIALSTPASENANSPEQPVLCNTFLKKGEKQASYVSSFKNQEGKAVKVTTTSFKAADDASVSWNVLYPPKKDEQRELLILLEAAIGIEPMNKGFAVHFRKSPSNIMECYTPIFIGIS